MQDITLYDEDGNEVATVAVPTRQVQWGTATPEIIKWQNRYWAYQEETDSYIEGTFYEVSS